MATVKFEGEEREVADGGAVVEACEDMGLPFGCQDGLCGTCMSTVVEGRTFRGEGKNKKEAKKNCAQNVLKELHNVIYE